MKPNVQFEQCVSQNRTVDPISFRKARSPMCRKRWRRPGRGTILIVVLVCLVAASTILLGVVGLSIRHRQQVRTEVQLEQTYWLLDAGIGTAIAKFKQDPDFEDFAITTDETLKTCSGSVEIIAVKRNDKQVVLRVTAKLQGHHELSPITQRSRVIVLKINNPIKTISDELDEGNRR